MDNSETMATLGKDTGQRQRKHKTITQHKKDEQHGPHLTPGMDPGAREG
jgi:hypothetical protein